MIGIAPDPALSSGPSNSPEYGDVAKHDRSARLQYHIDNHNLLQIVRSAASRYRRNSHDAEDFAQDVFLKLLSGGIDHYESSRPFEAWIRVVLANMARNVHRKESGKMELKLLSGSFQLEEGDCRISRDYGSKSPFETLASDDNVTIMMNEVQQLPECYTEMFSLRLTKGHTYQDIATALQIPLGTVQSGLFKSRKILAEKVA